MEESFGNIRMSESELASAIRIGGKGLDMKELEFVLDTAYQCFTYQVGYSTDGHKCVDNLDMEEASQSGSSLLYGEVLPQGVSLMLNKQHLAAAHSRTVYDLGMGTGKMALQAFLQFPNLRRVVGIEIAHSRYLLAERSLTTLVEFFPDVFSLVFWTKGEKVCLRTRNSERLLEYRRADLFRIGNINDADIVVLQTDFPPITYPGICKFVHALPQGTRVLTYLNLARIWDGTHNPFPFTRFAPGSRFLTSWSDKDSGHLFFLWRKTLPTCRYCDATSEHLHTYTRLGLLPLILLYIFLIFTTFTPFIIGGDSAQHRSRKKIPHPYRQPSARTFCVNSCVASSAGAANQ